MLLSKSTYGSKGETVRGGGGGWRERKPFLLFEHSKLLICVTVELVSFVKKDDTYVLLTDLGPVAGVRV